MMVDTVMRRKPVIDKLEQLGVESWMLDNLVHDAASGLGSQANNEGMKGQINFLKVICGWTDEAIIEAAKMERDDIDDWDDGKEKRVSYEKDQDNYSSEAQL